MAMYNGHMIRVSATEYKNNALKLLERVRQSGEAVQITKRGKPVAQLVRLEEPVPNRQFGRFRADLTIIGDIVGPIVEPEDWGDVA
jgi:prevent-host-death family protein